MSECCRKTFFYLAYAVATVGSVAYCFYLIWLLAYLKDSGYYWFFAAIPVVLLIRLITADISEKDAYWWPLIGVLLTVMCSFTMLTRQAYHFSSPDAFIDPRWVIMILKGSIVFFVSGPLTDKECRLQNILKGKDILSRALLDFFDIFDLIQLLSLNRDVGIGSSVTEGSSLEMAIQAFCTMSFLVVFCIYEVDHSERNENKGIEVWAIYIISLTLQNIPFLVIRIIVWANYDVFSLGFMTKNILAIVVSCKGIFGVEYDENGVPNNVNRLGQYIAYNSGSFPAILFICILSSAEYLSHFVPE